MEEKKEERYYLDEPLFGAILFAVCIIATVVIPFLT